MKEDLIFKLTNFYKVFADPSRLKILFLLSDKAYRVSEITEKLDISQSAVSHQLQLLRQLNLVKVKRVGKEIYYSISDHHINIILDYGLIHIKEEANE